MKKHYISPLLLAGCLAALPAQPHTTATHDTNPADSLTSSTNKQFSDSSRPAHTIFSTATSGKDSPEDWLNYANGRHRGLEFGVEAGLLASKGGASGSFRIGAGKRFSPHFYWGVGVGAFLGESKHLPVTTDFKGYIPTGNPRIQPFGLLRLGYALNLDDDIDIQVGREWARYEQKDHFLFQIMPGVQFPLSQRTDVSIAAGYLGMASLGGGGGLGSSFALTAGFDFHKGMAPRPKVPTRSKGLQLTLEADATQPWNMDGDDSNGGAAGGNLVITYKMSPQLSFGLGYGASYFRAAMIESDPIDAHYPNTVKMLHHSIFARGQWKFFDRKFTPLVNVDLGYRKYSYPDDVLKPYYYWRGDEQLDEAPGGAFFFKPSVGFSVRTTNNSYFDFKVGYNCCGKIKGKDFEVFDRRISRDEFTVSCHEVKTSGLFFSLGFTHTLKLFSE